MARLDDCSILQLKNRLGGTHDSISIQNLLAYSFAGMSSQAMCHATKEHLALCNMRQT
jgi:hypothetical protein